MRGLKSYFSGQGFAATLSRAIVGSSGLQIAGMGLGFLIGVQLARGLGVEGYGIYALGMSVTSILGIPTEFGLPQLMTREIAVASAHSAYARMRGFMLFSSGLVAISSIIIMMVGEVVLSTTDITTDPEKLAVFRWGLLLIPIVAQTKLCGSALQGLGRIVIGQIANLVLRPGLFALFLFICFVGFGISRLASTAMALQVAGAGAAMLTSMVLLAIALPRTELRGKVEYDAKSWIASAFPMALTEGMRALQGNLAVFLLGLLSTTSEIGLFRIADSVSAMCGSPASMLNIVAASLIARLWSEQDSVRLRKLVTALAMGITGGVVLFTLPVLLGGRELLEFVFGRQFGDALPTFAISSAANLVYGVAGPCGILLNMTGQEKRVAHAFAASLIVNVVIAAIVIPYLGSRGAALGNLSGGIVWNALLWLDCRRIYGIDTSLLSLFGRQAHKPS